MRSDVLEPEAELAWDAWCGRDPERFVACLFDGAVVFAAPATLDAAFRVWHEREGDVAGPAARVGLARLIARRAGQTEDESAGMLQVLTALAEGKSVEVRAAPPAPSCDDIARWLRAIPRDEWAARLGELRSTFFRQHSSGDEFLLWLLTEMWRGGGQP